MSNNKASNIPPRIPSSSISIARELGILFGFLLASLVIMAVYAVVWWGEFFFYPFPFLFFYICFYLFLLEWV
ncbi:hypothetical protein BDW59DRAFT_38269 [Aspergillus cavernicola]|uniref:Uncharacterized protein n=1 Tax=Aspergillus cavernicola TaxID=176166 RepID=A0ABR4IN83_9EURO